jgi:calreticulin
VLEGTVKMNALLFALLSTLVLVASATTYFKEEGDNKWTDRWVQSDFKESEGLRGDFVLSHGKWFGDAEADKGLQTSQDARNYAYTAKFSKFSNEGKDLVVQYTVKHEQKIDCGGGYIKVLPSTVDQKTFNGDSDYNIMFGPDICGPTKRVHVIFNYDGKNHLIKKTIPCETDEFTHLYTLIVHPDNTYEVQIDEKEVAKGSLKEDWDMLEPKEIKDPEASKPADWVDAKEIADPEDKKPEGWDDIPAHILDPEATTKPEDWDDELDGEWEAPRIPNPEFKGEWKAKQIPNPAYVGEWVHPKVPNPAYKDDDTLYRYKDNAAVGFEIWQVKSGTIFDNIILTDSIAEAKAHAEATWAKTKVAEKAAKEEVEKKEADEAAAAAAQNAEATADDEEEEKPEKDEL